MNPEDLKIKIEEALEAEHVNVIDESDGCGMKFQILVVSRSVYFDRHMWTHIFLQQIRRETNACPT